MVCFVLPARNEAEYFTERCQQCEETAFSRYLRGLPTGYCSERLVETSGRRIVKTELSEILYHYL